MTPAPPPPSGPVHVSSGGGATDYRVVIEDDLLPRVADHLAQAAPAVHRWAVVSDTNVGPLHGTTVSRALAEAGLDGELFLTPAGESEKTRRRWAGLTDQLLARGFGRDAGVVAVGGGVVGDLAGFVAATYMRGIPVVQVPTSLLAMIDASVGGKTGVDTPAGKNLVGAFHPPARVLVDPGVVETLPRAERAQGLVEAIKHGAILDRDYGAAVSAAAPGIVDGDPAKVGAVVRRSVELKAGVVSRDEREAGLREILNFGHTVAHALERAHSYALPHGTAVAQGMVWEARLGESLQVTAAGTAEVLKEWLGVLELPLGPARVPGAELESALLLDKKARTGEPRVVLLAEVGRVSRTAEGGWAHRVPAPTIAEAAPW